MTPATLELQKQIAQGLVQAMTEPWERIVVNFEMDTTPEGRVVDYRFFYISPSTGGDFKKTSIIALPKAVTENFIALNDAMLASEGARWGICDTFVDRSGKYNFKYDYGAPKRIRGVFDESSMGRFDKYLDTYRAERAAGGSH
jgi:hypothetical protein